MTILFVRKFSIYLTWLLLHTKLTPNSLTVVGLISSLLAAASLIGGYPYWASFFILFAVIMDFSDGEVSRYRDQTSLEGVYLDKVYIFIVHPVLFAGLAISESSRNASLLVMVSGYLCCIGTVGYAIVIDYAKSLTVFGELKSYLDQEPQGAEKSDPRVAKNIANPVSVLKKTETVTEKLLKAAISPFDFPAVFLVMALLVAVDAAISPAYEVGATFSVRSIFLCVCATSYVTIVMVFLAKNILRKEVTAETLKTFSAYQFDNSKYRKK